MALERQRVVAAPELPQAVVQALLPEAVVGRQAEPWAAEALPIAEFRI